MMMSHISFPFKSAFFYRRYFFLLLTLLPPRHRARDRQRVTESGVLRESSVCLFLSRRVFFCARVFLLCSFLDGFVLSSWGVLLLLELNWCLVFFLLTQKHFNFYRIIENGNFAHG